MSIAALLALVVGITLGLLGGGGSVLAVPMMVSVMGLEAHNAIASSLLLVGMASLAALTVHALHRNVAWRAAAVFAPPAMAGAAVGGLLAGALPGALLLTGFAVLMLISAAAMWRRRAEPDANAPTPPGWRMAALGATVGLLAGLVGAGGGFLIVPALVLAARLPTRRAVGTSLLVIALQSLAGFAGHLRYATVDAHALAVVVVAAMVGAGLGAVASEHTRPQRLRRGFSGLVMVVAVFMLVQQGAGARF